MLRLDITLPSMAAGVPYSGKLSLQVLHACSLPDDVVRMLVWFFFSKSNQLLFVT